MSAIVRVSARLVCLSLLLVWLATLSASPIPQIDGVWLPLAGNPNLGQYAGDKQQPVDFAIWQAADGTWQLWSCIRHTRCGGQTRLFYRWEGKRLTDAHWQPKGIAMQADPALGETEGGLQAPYVFREQDRSYMVYGDWERICLAASTDSKAFKRVLNERAQPALFRGPYDNSRDPMMLRLGDLYYCYYMGHKKGAAYQSAVFCRTSDDLKRWSEPVMVAAGGEAVTRTPWFGGDAECPFVVQKDGELYLFRTQQYGQDNVSTAYASRNPLNFGVGSDDYRIGTLPVAAPEIFCHDGQWYIAALNPALDGIRLAKLRWVIQSSERGSSR